MSSRAPIVPEKVVLRFEDIAQRLRDLDLPDVDVVVGIGSGGTVPASLVAFHLQRPLRVLSINYRDDDNRSRRDEPEVLEPFRLTPPGQRVLLVDDVSVSGATLRIAARALAGHEITTLVFKGKGDHVLLPEVGSCVVWPWKP